MSGKQKSKNSRNNNQNSEQIARSVNKKKKSQISEDDPYIADDEDEDYISKKRRSITDDNRLVMKVVKQGDYQHKQSTARNSGGLGNIEQEFFLPRNLTFFNNQTTNSTSTLKSGLRHQAKRDSEDNSRESSFDFDDEDYDMTIDNENMIKAFERAKTKAVFEMPRKPLANYSKWSRWSKCSPKCVTRRYKKCRPHARNSCGNDIIREIAYCYTEGSFCEEWISSQISKIGVVEASTKPPKPTRRTESPLTNSVSQNFYGSTSGSGSKRKNKLNLESKPQNFQCGFPSIRNKNNDFALKIIGGKTSRRAQVRRLIFRIIKQ